MYVLCLCLICREVVLLLVLLTTNYKAKCNNVTTDVLKIYHFKQIRLDACNYLPS